MKAILEVWPCRIGYWGGLLAAGMLGGISPVLEAQYYEILPAPSVESSEITHSEGTITEFGPDVIVLRSDVSSEPLTITSTERTTYVDESGAPVSREVVKTGEPVTIYYQKEGDRLVASRVIVRKAAPPSGTVIERRTTTTTEERE